MVIFFNYPPSPVSRSSCFRLGHADHVRHLEAAEERVGGEGTHPELPVVGLVALERLDDAFHLRHAGEGGREGGREESSVRGRVSLDWKWEVENAKWAVSQNDGPSLPPSLLTCTCAGPRQCRRGSRARARGGRRTRGGSSGSRRAACRTEGRREGGEGGVEGRIGVRHVRAHICAYFLCFPRSASICFPFTPYPSLLPSLSPSLLGRSRRRGRS